MVSERLTLIVVQGIVSFTLEELKGVPADVVSGYTKRKENGKELYDVAHKTPDIIPLVGVTFADAE